MMQSAAIFACAVSLSSLNCTILLGAVELLSFQQTACAKKLPHYCQWGLIHDNIVVKRFE